MRIPQDATDIVRSELLALETNQQYALSPHKRIEIYDAFGPTFPPAELRARMERLRAGTPALTPADRVRAHLAILTAERVLPAWRESLADVELFGEEEKDSRGPPWDPDALAWSQDIYAVPELQLPAHVLRMAGEVLDHPSRPVDPRKVLHEVSELHELLGRNLGYAEGDFPERAWYAAWAAYEALQQALGLGPFNRLPIVETTTDEALEGQGAAAAPALVAYAGEFDSSYWLRSSIPARRREFWRWWLEEAIPEAWTSVSPGEHRPAETVPFRDTVQPTVRRVGTIRVKRDTGGR